MKAIQVLGSQENHHIVLSDALSRPSPTGSQVLIKVHAAGITADEVIWPELYASPNRVPGHDISGIVEAFGPEYHGPLSLGESVYAMLHADAPHGGQSEYAIAMPNEVAVKPSSISHAQAAALPIPALTAWEAIFKHTKLAQGSKIFVTGASGAVGAMLVQIARKFLNAEVIGLASPSNHAMLAELGATKVLDYSSPEWYAKVHGMDAVFDTVGGDIFSKSWRVVKENGYIVTVGDPAPKWAFGRGQPEELQTYPNVKCLHFIVSPDGDALSEVASLIDDGALKPIPVQVFEVEEAVEAWKYASQRGRKGKAVIKFQAE
ncbi:NAD(P)-binding protein [Trichoderma citrinoviride]|uniref:NAD(P)-binding protein n=1 Tax=Trichoderma citrinoviride TaxID=58853 RepID=A0A2T4B1L9_9HYPO|nr:NAD(P)-binding protein [Trichoderma citrinoviride]PTB63219.1 NAD(P)-binding protein [Trichoderma citrinoviride]